MLVRQLLLTATTTAAEGHTTTGEWIVDNDFGLGESFLERGTSQTSGTLGGGLMSVVGLLCGTAATFACARPPSSPTASDGVFAISRRRTTHVGTYNTIYFVIIIYYAIIRKRKNRFLDFKNLIDLKTIVYERDSVNWSIDYYKL